MGGLSRRRKVLLTCPLQILSPTDLPTSGHLNWRGVMYRFSGELRALSAAGFVAFGFVLSIAVFSLANPGTTRSLSEYVGSICATVLQSSAATEAPFISANVDAMKKMMVDMEIQPTGNVDRDFAAMMVPHHEGAIAMAIAVLRYGHNEQIKRLAQEIIVTQRQEISAMRLAVGEPLPARCHRRRFSRPHRRLF